MTGWEFRFHDVDMRRTWREELSADEELVYPFPPPFKGTLLDTVPSGYLRILTRDTKLLKSKQGIKLNSIIQC